MLFYVSKPAYGYNHLNKGGEMQDFNAVFETSRLYCREWQNEDASECAHIYAKREVMQFIPGGIWGPERTAAIIQRFKERTAKTGLPIYPVLGKQTKRIMGHVGLGRVEDTEKTEVFFILDDAHWGQGYAREAADRFLEFAFAQLRLERVFALAFPANVRSQAVIRNLGMEREGDAYHFGVDLVQYIVTYDMFWSARNEKGDPR